MSLSVISSPDILNISGDKITVFIGGSIELGTVRDWQSELIQWLGKHEFADRLLALNPRREQWDSSWPVDDPGHPDLRQQIEWELRAQDRADISVYFFASHTLSPITLLELGMYAHKKPVICIEDGYSRRANVIVTAEHFGWLYHTSWDGFLHEIDVRIRDAVTSRVEAR